MGEFFLTCSSPELRNKILRADGCLVEGLNLQLHPWSRTRGATAITATYRVRVCIEGLPRQARSLKTLADLCKARSQARDLKLSVSCSLIPKIRLPTECSLALKLPLDMATLHSPIQKH